MRITYKYFFIITVIKCIYAYEQLCVVNKCGINGKCVIKKGAETCLCKQGYVGSICQFIDPCESKPCNNHGSCYPVLIHLSGREQAFVYCQCYAGFSGSRCEIAGPKPCSSNPCYNNAICTDHPNNVDYSCKCVGPYTGKKCGTYINYCSNNVCKNNGKCIALYKDKTYFCECQPGYYGLFCEYEINECSLYDQTTLTFKSPCLNNGRCRDLINAYSCSCPAPYTGKNCEIYQDPCISNPCGNTATCISEGAHFMCKCNPGFFGQFCQRNPCISNPCKTQNAQCIPIERGALQTCGQNHGTDYVCVCYMSDNLQYASSIC